MGEGIRGEKQREERKEREEEKKERKRERKEKKKGKEKGRFETSSSDLSVFRWSEFIGSRVKVRLLDEGYAPRGRDSSSFGLFPP